MSGRWIVGGLVGAMLVGATPIEAQLPRLLAPRPEQGLRVAPFFDGWYANPDGTISLSFGYSNLNKESVDIPIGPDNFIVPKEYDGRQPTFFQPAVVPPPQGSAGAAAAAGTPAGAAGGTAGTTPAGGAATAGGGAAGTGAGNPNISRYDRERGVFTVTVPASYKGDVVWTLRYQGQTWSIPGRTRSTAYQLSWPMAMGSVPPLLRFQPDGPTGRGPTGIHSAPLQARVGAPLPLTIWLTDDAVHEKEPIPVKREVVPSMNVTWYKHSGPAAPVVFSPPKEPVADPAGRAATTATFGEPGDYVIRVRGDSFGNTDSAAADQCCWTNGYWNVVVTR